jgi:hypothetical protein
MRGAAAIQTRFLIENISHRKRNDLARGAARGRERIPENPPILYAVSLHAYLNDALATAIPDPAAIALAAINPRVYSFRTYSCFVLEI